MKTTLRLIALGLSFTATVATAQQFDDAANFALGGFDVTPTVDIGLKYDDNVTRANIDSISSWSRIISPHIMMESSLGASQVTLGYRLRNEDFFSSKEDNYTDHFFVAQADVEFNARNRVIASLNFEDGHDARGSNFSIGTGASLSEPDKYKQTELDILYSYGAFNSDGRLDLNFDIRSLNYDIDTPLYRARDRDISRLAGTFYYRIGAVTDAVFEARYTSIDYQFALNPMNVLDSDEVSYLVGIEWKATAQTSGFAKVGYQEKDFESSLREDFDGFDWELGVLWEPVDYSSLEFITSSGTNETNGEGNFIRDNRFSLEWKHEWLERLRSSVQISFANERYEGQLIDGFDIRSDDNRRLRASVYYQFRRWLNFELGYVYDERESNRDAIDFDRNQFILNALITL
ncbi:outer membrane beta-barrel protein [Glaciecola siphonariae]|uniref:Outer membrane beta-barrel protein n=1 Tax=Glaciecola siphonariae TaxID=521012 RepID=A0ABV9M269_9ALTE